MVMVGAFMEKTKIFTPEALDAALDISIKHKKFIPLNKSAIDKGVEKVNQ
jgi:Pyruvate/2-oxoacid:ferredoxin oxidoreductase gamma subunit